MKKLYLIVFTMLVIINGYSQGCLPEGITFTTQAQIDSFQVNHPGCTEIEGDVMIGVEWGVTNINNLNGLSVLNSIGGSLSIISNPLTSLIGLENLNYIGGSLLIGDFYWSCHGNDSLVDLTGLNSLDSIGGDLEIDCNQGLISLTGLKSLNFIGGILKIGNAVYLGHGGNPSLISLSGLSNLTTIEGGILISRNGALTSLTGLEGLTSLQGGITICYSPGLTKLSGLDNLSFIGGGLDLYENNFLVSLSGLGHLDSIGGSLYIGYCYGGATQPHGGNNILTSLQGLKNLTHIGGTLNIGQNNSLKSLTGLDNIDAGSITFLEICSNDSLSNCEVQSICDYLGSPNGTIEIFNNAPGCNNPEEVKTACGVGQKILLDLIFTAVDSAAYVQLDSIRVMNRTQGGDTLIYWPDTTLTVEITPGDQLLYIGYSKRYPYGIQDLYSTRDNFTLFQNYPNPVTDQSTVSLFIPEKGTVNVLVTDVWGKNIINTALSLNKGFHSFHFTAGDANLVFITALWNGISRSIKVISTGSVSGKRCMLDYTGSGNENMSLKKSSFNAGFVTQESGILDLPDTNKTYIFQFATHIPCPGTPTVTYGGQVYNTIQIFSQCWLKENLNVGTMIPGDQIMSDNGIIEKYCYNNEPDSCTKYGGLYNWEEMMQYTIQQGSQGICPPGWHLPTDEEWEVLEGAVDSQYGIGDPEWDLEWEYRGFDAGLNLKTSGGWYGGSNGNDLFGFSVLPAGSHLDNGVFDKVGYYGHLWTSTKDDISYAKYRYMDSVFPEVYRRHSNLDYGISVRCVRDY